MTSTEIRPMADGDVPGVVEAWLAAIIDLRSRLHLPAADPTPADRDRLAGRVRHFLRTDPAGSWVADQDGRVVGLAQSFVREYYWVLSLLGVDPSAQTAGAGRGLLEKALEHGTECRGTIQASHDSRAVRLYSTAGFYLHPSMDARGTIGPVPTAPAGVRTGGLEDLPVVDDIDRAVRGSARTTDIGHMMDNDKGTLLLDGDRGYAVVRPDRVVTLAGRDETAATRVLETALAMAPRGGQFEIGWLTAPQQWAVGPALAAGLSLHPRGPVMVRGMDGPPAPYLPSGGFG